MNKKDMQNNVVFKTSIEPLAIGANATKTGKVVDRKGYAGVQFICSYGAVTTTGTIATLVIKEGDVTGTMTSVADSNLRDTEALASLLATTPRTSGVAQNVVKKIGYIGNKRYVQALLVKTGVTSVGCAGVAVMLFNPETAPTSNP